MSYNSAKPPFGYTFRHLYLYTFDWKGNFSVQLPERKLVCPVETVYYISP